MLTSDTAYRAFAAIKRSSFIPEEAAFLDAAVPIGGGAQMSAPHVHAHALDLLAECLGPALAAGSAVRVLDIGSGSGFMCAALGRVVAAVGGEVIAVEHIKELHDDSLRSITDRHGYLMEAGGPLQLVHGDAREVATRPGMLASFHAVHCGAALPEAERWVTDLLRPGGRAVLPIGPENCPQWLCTADRGDDGAVSVARHIRVLYVPVTSERHQRERGDDWESVVESCRRNSSAVLTGGGRGRSL